jgi:hypothetical protein
LVGRPLFGFFEDGVFVGTLFSHSVRHIAGADPLACEFTSPIATEAERL